MRAALAETVVAAAVVLAAAATRVGAQEERHFAFLRKAGGIEQRVARFHVRSFPIAAQPGGWSWITANVEVVDGKPHEVEVEVVSPMPVLEARRRLRLAAGERATLSLPASGTGMGWNLIRCHVDGEPVGDVNLSTSRYPASTTGIEMGLVVSDDPDFARAIAALIDAKEGVRAGSASAAVVAPPELLPDRWSWLSGASVIVVDCDAPGLTPDRQRVLADYAAGGGRLVLTARSGAIAIEGPLRELIGEGSGPGATEGHYGLGTWAVDPTSSPSPSVLRHPSGARWGAGAPDVGLLAFLDLPGLGHVRFGFVVLLLTAFATAVCVEVIWLVRRRRAVALLVVVPATGLGFAAAVVVYGLLSDGLGVKGSIRSFTLLDQRRHTAVAVAQRTLYAGISPSRLSLDAATLPASSSWRTSTADSLHRLSIDLDRGEIAGAALPSRVPTQMATTTVAPCRERLRFRRAPGGALELRAGSGFEPVEAEGALVVRDFDGSMHVLTGESLRRVGDDRADPFVHRALRAFADVSAAHPRAFGGVAPQRGFVIESSPAETSESASYADEPSQAELRRWIRDDLVGTLAPGSYLARTRAAPAVDDLGLEVAWVREEHVVLGRLAPEDIE